MAHEAGALFHTDAVQAAGRVPIRLSGSAIDLLSLSGHKLHGPKGVGALYVRRGVPLRPLLHGGRQERGRRAGTENAPAIVGLGKAAALARAALVDGPARVGGLRDRLERGVLAAVPGCRVLGDRDNRLPNTTLVAFERVDGEAVLARLARAGIAASAGSACASGALAPSHVLAAMKVPAIAAHGAIRFSLSRDSDDADVDRVLEVLPAIIAALRARRPAPAPGAVDA
jgi:cysteine desulfurase